MIGDLFVVSFLIKWKTIERMLINADKTIDRQLVMHIHTSKFRRRASSLLKAI